MSGQVSALDEGIELDQSKLALLVSGCDETGRENGSDEPVALCVIALAAPDSHGSYAIDACFAAVRR